MAPLSSWRSRFAAWSVGVVNRLSRLTGRGSGTVAGGRVGLRIDPDLLAVLSRGREIILVTGTNGKTTTSAMLRQGWGGHVAGNQTGANMPEGHVAALCASTGARVVLETDEAWLADVVRSSEPAAVVLLNLSRDQLDRANEVRRMAQRWRDCLSAKNFEGVVVANASDPLVVYAAQLASRVRWVDVPNPWRGDSASCPHCTRAIDFGPRGWSCACGFAQPDDVAAVLSDQFRMGGRSFVLQLALPGRFNEVNAALALSALAEVGVDPTAALARIASLENVQGRYGRRRFAQRTVRLLLAKNPAGTAALFEAIAPHDEIWVAINARIADGKDPSWLYDVPFEVLAGRDVKCLGERRLDLATRLTYGGVACEVVDDLDVLAMGPADVTMVANYTAFREWTERTSPC